MPTTPPSIRLEECRRLRCHKAAVLCVRYTSDGLYCMSSGADRKVVLWNPSRSAEATGGLVVQEYFGPHSKEVPSVAIAKDSARFASCSGSTAFLWDVSTGSVVRRMEGHAGIVNDVSFAGLEDSLVVTASYDNTARMWDLRSQSRAPIQIMDDFKDSVTSLAVSSDRILAGSVDGSLTTFDVRRGLTNRDEFGSPVTSVKISGDAACVAASCLDSSVRLLEIVSSLSHVCHRDHVGKRDAAEHLQRTLAFHILDRILLFQRRRLCSILLGRRSRRACFLYCAHHPRTTR